MATLHTTKNVEVEELQRTLSDGLGPSYRVSAASASTVKVGRTGVIPSHVNLSHTGGGTTFAVHTSGLIVSRLVQAAVINPRVRRVLADAYSKAPQ